jgi:hypothetical protein
MPAPAALDADPIRPRIRPRIRLSRHLRRTTATVAGWIGSPRGAALAPSAAPLTPTPSRVRLAGAACCSPCSVELPGEVT